MLPPCWSCSCRACDRGRVAPYVHWRYSIRCRCRWHGEQRNRSLICQARHARFPGRPASRGCRDRALAVRRRVVRNADAARLGGRAGRLAARGTRTADVCKRRRRNRAFRHDRLRTRLRCSLCEESQPIRRQKRHIATQNQSPGLFTGFFFCVEHRGQDAAQRLPAALTGHLDVQCDGRRRQVPRQP